METILTYIWKVNLLIILFFTGYYLLLKNVTFFKQNRFYLLFGYISAFVLPFITFTENKIIPLEVIEKWNQISDSKDIQQQFQTIQTTETFDYVFYLVCIYLAVCFFFLLRFIVSIYTTIKLTKSVYKTKDNHQTIVYTNKNIQPFSFFNFIVVNPYQFDENSLNNVLAHEKIHSKQWHSLDILLTEIAIIFFWYNPFVWFYNNAIRQNLEFLADFGAIKALNCKKDYQITLLNNYLPQNNLSITNSFYQSLIKKRIVMLNKNHSSKANYWKYLFVLPVLSFFMLSFQTKVNYTFETKNTSSLSDSISWQIDKSTTDKEIGEKCTELKDKYGISVNFDIIKRNEKMEITELKISISDGKGYQSSTHQMSSSGIDSVLLNLKRDDNGKFNFDFATLDSPNATNPKSIIQKQSKIIKENFAQMDQNSAPTPPDVDGKFPTTPPTPPVSPLLKMPKAPMPPKLPKNLNDKKAMEQYEKLMLAYEKEMGKYQLNMEPFEKAMEIFGKQMEEFGVQMELWGKNNEPYFQDLDKKMREMERKFLEQDNSNFFLEFEKNNKDVDKIVKENIEKAKSNANAKKKNDTESIKRKMEQNKQLIEKALQKQKELENQLNNQI